MKIHVVFATTASGLKGGGTSVRGGRGDETDFASLAITEVWPLLLFQSRGREGGGGRGGCEGFRNSRYSIL
jgi:hypothetical protein